MTKAAISNPGSVPIHEKTSRELLLLLGFLIAAPVGILAQAPSEPANVAIPSVTLAVSPLVPKSSDGEQNVLTVTIDSVGLTNVTLRLVSQAWPEPKTRTLPSLAPGKQTVDLEVPLLGAATSVAVRLETPSLQREFGPFTVQPPRKWTVYLAQHTHTDIGYTRPQTEILPEHLRYIDYALDYCDLTDSYPDDARFRWTCETSWAVREYLKGRPAAQIERLKKRVAEGRIEICGLMLNMSEIATESSLAALLRPCGR